MKNTVKIGLVLASLWIIIKLVFFYMGISDQGFKIGIYINILFVLLAAAVGLFLYKTKEKEKTDNHIFNDIKVGLQGSIVYTVIISLFVYVYYNKIDPFVMQNQIDDKIEMARTQTEDPEIFKKIVDSNPGLKDASKEDYIKLVKEDAELLHSGFVQSTFTLIAMMLASIFYSILIAFLFKKLIFKY